MEAIEDGNPDADGGGSGRTARSRGGEGSRSALEQMLRQQQARDAQRPREGEPPAANSESA